MAAGGRLFWGGVAVALVVAGCGGHARVRPSEAGTTAGAGAGGAGADEPTSGEVPAPYGGSRLKARVAEAKTGARQLLGWQDTELDALCAFQVLPSGELRCLPSSTDTAWVSEDSEAWYADSACSKPVRELSLGVSQCAAPRFAQLIGADAVDPCRSLPKYLRIGDEAPTLHRKVGSECQVLDAPNDGLTHRFFEVEPFALEGFARGTLREGAAADGIRPVYVTSEDGARAFWTFRDESGGFDCALGETTEGQRCVPSDAPVVTGSNFSDANCQVPAAMAPGCSQAESAAYVIDASPDATGNARLRVLEGGERLDISYVGVAAPGACVEQGSNPSVFAVGDEVPSSRFAEGAVNEVTDSQGLVAPVLQAGGWSVAGMRQLRSGRLGGYDCAFLTTSDGVVRCVPAPTFFEVEFADAACNEPVIEGWEETEAVTLVAGCPAQVTVLARGDEYTGSVYRSRGGQCELDHEQPPQPSRTVHHRLAAELPPETFPATPIALR